MTECIICGMIFNAKKRHSDVCPYCGWIDGFDYELGEDERNSANLMTRKEARDNYRKGLNIFGEPLEKRPPDDTEED